MNDAATLVMERPPAEKAADAVVQWLGRFEAALTAGDPAGVAALFGPECHYRDMLAFSWTIQPVFGTAAIGRFLMEAQKTTNSRGFVLAQGRTPPRIVRRLGVEVYEAIFRFETATGRGFGVVRLPTATPGHAWVLMTSLDELKGHEDRTGARRPSGDAYSRNFGGLNWLDQRNKARKGYAGRDPEVLVVGGGQNGLAVAACLGQFRLSIRWWSINSHARGDNWRACAITRWLCTIRSRSTTCLICRFRLHGRNISPRTCLETGWKCTPKRCS